MRTARYTVLIGLLALCGATVAAADEFTVDWYTLANGGEFWTTGGTFELSGTIGQPGVGVALTGGEFTVIGGFWLAVTPTCLGDVNCDGVVDFDDINPFVAAISGVLPCFLPNADVNGDGRVDFDDINPFVVILSSGGTCW